MALTYAQAVERLEGALRFGVNPSLDSITAMCEALDRPQDSFRVIQVAGTNGKSSVVWMTEAILKGCGAKSASYTSPHLHEYKERMRIGGVDCTEDDFAAAVGVALDAAERAGVDEPTEFELLTTAALWLFRERDVEVAVLEVGMGGRWDATSVASPQVAVVTGVGMDHSEHLGETREEIASEKAWIIREGAVAVLGPGTQGVEDIFQARAAEGSSRILTVGASILNEHDFTLPASMPTYMLANAGMAREAAAAFLGRSVEAGEMTAALADVRVPARFEIVSTDPLVVVDGSHNPQAATVLGSAIHERFEGAPRVVLAVLDDKDAAGIVDALLPVVRGMVVTRSHSSRSMEPGELAKVVGERVGVRPLEFDSLDEALEALGPDMRDGLVVTGSLTIAAEARAHFLGM